MLPGKEIRTRKLTSQVTSLILGTVEELAGDLRVLVVRFNRRIVVFRLATTQVSFGISRMVSVTGGVAR